MPSDTAVDLTFPGIEYTVNETPWDLAPLLYRGGAAVYVSKVAAAIASGQLGNPISSRAPLLERLHDELTGTLTGGGSPVSVKASIYALRLFYSWADATGRCPAADTVEQDFVDYSEHLLHRVRTVRDLKEDGAYEYAVETSRLLSSALDLKIGLLVRTRISRPKAQKAVLGTLADKQNLEQTFAFGHALLDISDALSINKIRGTLPVAIEFRTGEILHEWCLLDPPERVKVLNPAYPNASERRKALQRRAEWEADPSARTRFSVINLRIEAELLIFIAQTGMNLTQAQRMKAGSFRYQSHSDGLKVYRVYKGRRGGEVEFEIYSEYRAIFERYLSWRKEMFPADDDGLLFPFVTAPGKSRSSHQLTSFQAIEKKCKQLAIKFFRPRSLRKMRINWLLRRSRDVEQTAEMAQHSQETLLRVYDQPHHHVAAVEISRFHQRTDPAIAMPGAGVCVDQTPYPVPDAPSEAPAPDCRGPAGCLFCIHQRDIDSQDHTWSLATYRYLKSLELARYRPPAAGGAPHPALAAIDRLTAKLSHLAASNEARASWLREAQARVDEGDYHPKWDGFIQLMEAS